MGLGQFRVLFSVQHPNFFKIIITPTSNNTILLRPTSLANQMPFCTETVNEVEKMLKKWRNFSLNEKLNRNTPRQPKYNFATV